MSLQEQRPTAGYFTRAWRGEVPLWHSYWLLLILPSALFRMFSTYWSLGGLSVAIRNPRLWEFVNTGTLILALVVYVFGAVSVLRSKSKSSWTGIAKLLTVIGLLATVAISVASFFPEASELETQLKDAARGIKMARGEKVDDVTTIKGASYQNSTFLYEYYLTDEAGRSLQSSTQRQFALTSSLKVKTCDNLIKGFEGVLKRVEHRYYTQDDLLRFQTAVNATECLPGE